MSDPVISSAVYILIVGCILVVLLLAAYVVVKLTNTLSGNDRTQVHIWDNHRVINFGSPAAADQPIAQRLLEQLPSKEENVS